MWLSILQSIALVVISLSLLVIVHELGHFLAAKWAKIKTLEFGIGYPPKARLLFRRWQTNFTLNWIPFGGFVRMAGEDADLKVIGTKTKAGEYYYATIPKRLVVVYAGVLANLLFGILAFAVVFFQTGIPVEITQPRVAAVLPNTPASDLNLPLPVEIIGFMVDGQLVETTDVTQVQELVAAHVGQELQMVTTGNCQVENCDRTPQTYNIYARTQEEIPTGEGSLGIVFDQVNWVFYPWYEMIWRSIWYGFEQALSLAGLILQVLYETLGQAIHGNFQNELAGPIGIVQQVHSAQIAEAGWLPSLSFAGMLSVNLALMNFLPIPPLDGGKGVLTLVEWFLGKRKAIKLEHFLSYGGYLILMALILSVTARDIWRIAIQVPGLLGW